MLAAYMYAQPGVSERLSQGQQVTTENHKAEFRQEMEEAEKKLERAGGTKQ